MSTTTDELNKIEKWITRSRNTGFIIGSIAIVLGFWPYYVCGFDCGYNEFGDYVGGVSGSILSIGAMSFLYMTYLIQRKQIIIQQTQIELQKGEIEDQKKKLQNDEKVAVIQHLHEWFFTLFAMHNQTVAGFEVRQKENSDVKATGKDSFRLVYEDIFRLKCHGANRKKAMDAGFRTYGDGIDTRVELTEHEATELFRNQIYDGHSFLAVYFKSLNQVLRHLSRMQDEQKIDITEYTHTIRSQFNDYELAVMYYFIRIDEDMMNDSMLSIASQIKQHDILQDLRESKLIPVVNSTFTTNPYNR